jgi:hypothetical protein
MHEDLAVRLDRQKEGGAGGEGLRAGARGLSLRDHRMMPGSGVFSPVPVTSTRKNPEPFSVPAMTLSPVALQPVAARP